MVDICIYRLQRSVPHFNRTYSVSLHHNTILLPDYDCEGVVIAMDCVTVHIRFPTAGVTTDYHTAKDNHSIISSRFGAFFAHGGCAYNPDIQDSHPFDCLWFYNTEATISSSFYVRKTCNKGQYTCADGTCISYILLADGSDDCEQGEDEILLQTRHTGSHCVQANCYCGPHYFSCQSGGCLHWHNVCDGHVQCSDASDEYLCAKNQNTLATSNEDKHTIGGLFNDYIFHTLTYSVIQTCPYQFIPCRLGQSLCFPIRALCMYNRDNNGYLRHCRDGAHLIRCSMLDCPVRFKCPGAYCIPLVNLCDSRNDCPGGEDEDEQSCHSPLSCPGMLRCKGGGCVHQRDVCNGHVDCISHSDDEYLCDLADCPSRCECRGLSMTCLTTEDDLINVSRYLAVLVTGNSADVPTVSNSLELLMLNLSNLGITTLNQDSFHQSIYLRYLDLSRNKLTAIRSHTFQGLNKLLILPLKENSLTLIESEAFSGLSSLKDLNLSGMAIDSIGVSAFKIPKARVLDISHNSLTVLDLMMMQNLSILEKLHMEGNNISLLQLGDQALSLANTIDLYTTQVYLCCWTEYFSCKDRETVHSLCQIPILRQLRYLIGTLGVVITTSNTFIIALASRHTSGRNKSAYLSLLLYGLNSLMGVSLVLLVIKDSLFDALGHVQVPGGDKHIICAVAGFLQLIPACCASGIRMLQAFSFHRQTTAIVPQESKGWVWECLSASLVIVPTVIYIIMMFDFRTGQVIDVGSFCYAILSEKVIYLAAVMLVASLLCDIGALVFAGKVWKVLIKSRQAVLSMGGTISGGEKRNPQLWQILLKVLPALCVNSSSLSYLIIRQALHMTEDTGTILDMSLVIVITLPALISPLLYRVSHTKTNKRDANL